MVALGCQAPPTSVGLSAAAEKKRLRAFYRGICFIARRFFVGIRYYPSCFSIYDFFDVQLFRFTMHGYERANISRCNNRKSKVETIVHGKAAGKGEATLPSSRVKKLQVQKTCS